MAHLKILSSSQWVRALAFLFLCVVTSLLVAIGIMVRIVAVLTKTQLVLQVAQWIVTATVCDLCLGFQHRWILQGIWLSCAELLKQSKWLSVVTQIEFVSLSFEYCYCLLCTACTADLLKAKLSRRLLCSVRFVFVSTFVVGITNLSK